MHSTKGPVLFLVAAFLFSFSSFARAESFNFIYPFRDQVVAPGERLLVKLDALPDFKTNTLPVDFSLMPTVKLSYNIKNILLGSINTATTTFFLSIPSDVLEKNPGAQFFQIIASRGPTNIVWSEMFQIVKGFATSTVYAGGLSPYIPKCSVSTRKAAPNQPIVFAPGAPYQNDIFSYKWVGEASSTSKGTTTMAFIYPGNYTIVLEATASNKAVYKTQCPTIAVSFDATSTTFRNTGAFYPYPFKASSTRSLIPHEADSMSAVAGCFNLLQNLSYGYEDDVKNQKDGIIYTLQKFLKDIGYLKTEPTGYFGNLTRLAVKDFQWENGIESTGFVGPLTRAKMKAKSCSTK